MSSAAKAAARTDVAAQLRPVLPAREEQFSTLFAGATLGMSVCTLEGQILESNAALAKMLGYRRDELAGIYLRALLADDPHSTEHLEGLKRGTGLSFKRESRILRKDGSDLWGLLTLSVVRGPSDEPAFLLALLEDATENRHATEKSREAEKMEVIGRLAGGIAHDFNNLLTGILLYCDLLSDGIKPGSRLLQHVEEIRLAGEKGAALTQQLLAIARKQVPQPRPILLNHVLTSTENLLRRLTGEQIELVTQLSPRVRSVRADPAQLRQVLLNLVLNARDAMPQGGRITLRTQANQRIDGAQPAVALVVEDTGCGMDEPTRARLFEPFFTTKAPGQGTGLGLATVQRIIAESGGTIDVTSKQGHGTRVQVLFPVLRAVPSASRAVRTPFHQTDHPVGGRSLQRVLHHAGYHVLAAANGKRALKVIADSPDEVGLLLADWMMPGMTGRDLAEKLLQQKPNLKVLLISGYHDHRKGLPVGTAQLIRKPFAGRVLLERIREILDSKGDSPW